VPAEDKDISKDLERSFTRRGVKVVTNARFDPKAVSKEKDGVCVEVGPEGGKTEEIRAEVMLVATGRAANVEDIGLESTKVEIEKGLIKVNGRMRTKEPHVYAIGDVIGGLWLAHTAAHEGIVAAHTIAGDGEVHEVDYVKQPRATYCRPEIASIGLTEQQCQERVRRVGASVGLSDEQLIEMYRMVALARAIDERMWVLNRAGRIPFVISGQGHEGAQVGITWALKKGHDWVAPFYRSIATAMTFGMTARDMMTAQYATANDPSSGGRQMPGHYGHAAHNLLSVSSPVATQILHAVGIALAAKIRKTGQVAMTFMGEGSSNQGDVHEGLNF